jgi:tetratricopeptide (TPR) repeat protein
MTIYGLGGCGKSALALEFAYRALARDARHLVFWVPAISQESFELAYRDIGIRLRIPGITDDNADFKQLVEKILSSDSTGHWLMIVDNADDPGVLMGGAGGHPGSARLHDCLPYSNGGKILFTTRSRKAAGDLTQSSVLELNDMSKAEARQLLARRISKPALLDDGKAIDKLLELLTYLPLAIVQAAAFINNNDISVSGYISLFRKAGTEAELFGEHFEDPSRYREMESTIAKTWHISFDQIQRQDSLAAGYLSFMACIDRINIPQSLLPPGASPLQQAKAIGSLKGYAFIAERQQVPMQRQGGKLFDIHRLVHMASIWWLKEHGEWAACVGKAADRLVEVVPHGGHQNKEEWTAYLPHALHVAAYHDTLDEVVRALLLDQIGRCQSTLGQYSAAETTHRQALLLRKKSLGKEHDQTLTSMNQVGVALKDQGKYEAAEAMHRQTLARREKVLGPEHPDTLTSMSNLAGVLDSQGKYEESESMNRQTLARREKVLGPEHPDTLTSMSNLALVLKRQGKYEEAESMNGQTLARREKVLGPDHPSTLTSMSNLALVLDSQGKYEEAESMNRQTLARREKVLGPEHPDTLTSMSNLAGVLDSQGKYEEAESMNRQTLARREKVLGPEHPSTLTSVYCLAHLLANRHRYDESLVMYERACTAYGTVLGKDHPTTRACRQRYSETLASQEQDRFGPPPKILDSGITMNTGKRSKL